RNSNDWRNDRGYVNSLEVLAINDTSARMTALLSGAVHFVTRVDPNIMGNIEKRQDLQIFNTPSGGHHIYTMRCDKPPYDNLDLRLALKYATDRDAMVKIGLRNNAVIANDHPIPRHDPFHAQDIPQRPYDPDKAKFHLKKSGYDAPIV